MIVIKINGRVKAELPDNINLDKFQTIISLFLFNLEVTWSKIEIDRVKYDKNKN